MYIVFDALDECPGRDELLTLLHMMHGWRLDILHCLVISRYQGDIEKKLRRLVSHEIPIDESLIAGDIRLYVSKTLADDIKFQMWSAEEKAMIEAALTWRQHGM